MSQTAPRGFDLEQVEDRGIDIQLVAHPTPRLIATDAAVDDKHGQFARHAGRHGEVLLLDIMVGEDQDETLVVESAPLQIGEVAGHLGVGIVAGIQIDLELGRQTGVGDGERGIHLREIRHVGGHRQYDGEEGFLRRSVD